MIDSIIPLLSLIAMEVVLGIDNIIFVSIIAGRLPANPQRCLAPSGLQAGDYGICTRQPRALATGRALSLEQQQQAGARLHPGAGAAALSGQPAKPVPEQTYRAAGPRNNGAHGRVLLSA